MSNLNEWEDNGVFESEGSEDTRPSWAKKIQGYHRNREQIDRIKKVVGEDVADSADIDIKTRKVRIGDRSYVVDVFLDGKNVGNYSY